MLRWLAVGFILLFNIQSQLDVLNCISSNVLVVEVRGVEPLSNTLSFQKSQKVTFSYDNISRQRSWSLWTIYLIHTNSSWKLKLLFLIDLVLLSIAKEHYPFGLGTIVSFDTNSFKPIHNHIEVSITCFKPIRVILRTIVYGVNFLTMD